MLQTQSGIIEFYRLQNQNLKAQKILRNPQKIVTLSTEARDF